MNVSRSAGRAERAVWVVGRWLLPPLARHAVQPSAESPVVPQSARDASARRASVLSIVYDERVPFIPTG
ncbi:hypothetical protein KIN20_012069 [Parelaphostrongylus tenuis]|uniref:Uncharacterized protein n=1 Tax=Parelaphostrongylus tenuis TaxID=148309 RepID=A0AAD5MBN1_PARTN|nr:hypothetical protein KIN20_012069 [Parelaphostrongylus tenuis]